MQFQQLDVYHRVEIGVAGVHSTWSKLWLNWCSCSRAPGFSTELLERIPKTPDTIFRTMVGVAQYALQEPRQSQQHDDGLNSNGDQATLPPPDLIHARVCHSAAVCTSQVLGTSVRHALHQPGQYRVLAGHVAIEFTLQSQQMYSKQTLEQFHRIFHRAVAFRLMEGQIRVEERQPRGAS